MPTMKLTDAAVKRLPVPKAGRVEYFDALLPGFGLRVSDKGHRAWIVFYRIGQTLRRFTLGTYPTLPLADARTKARDALEAVSLHRDPAAEKTDRRGGSAHDTLKAVGELFVTRYAKANQRRSWRETERILRIDVYPALGHRPIGDIRRPDILELLDTLAEKRPEKKRKQGRGRMHRGGPMAARNVHKTLRKLFRWAHEDRGILESNPLAGVKAPAPNVARDRVLSDDEIRALWKHWVEAPTPFGDVCRAMLLTGQRVREVANMRRSEIDAEGRWLIPSERYKTRLPHVVPLGGAVRAILEAQPQFADSDLVFTLTGKPLGGWSKAKDAMDEASGVEDWQIRDLRRTARTLMTRAGVDFHIAERTIGHAIGGVAAVYDRWGYLPEKTRALETLAAAVERIVNPPSGANVVPMAKTGVMA